MEVNQPLEISAGEPVRRVLVFDSIYERSRSNDDRQDMCTMPGQRDKRYRNGVQAPPHSCTTHLDLDTGIRQGEAFGFGV